MVGVFTVFVVCSPPQLLKTTNIKVRKILKDVEIVNFHSHDNIYETYVKAYENKKPIILVEYPEKYYA